MARIRLEGVQHAFDDTAVLTGIELDIANGEAHALLGGSGAGKTTLLNILSGLLAPTAGRVLFDDRTVNHVEPAQRNVAQVFQFPVLYEGMTVAGNLAFPLRNRRARNVHERVGRVAELLGLEPLLDVKSHQLSIYDRQKVSLGRALVREDVSVLLLDEPLTAVEPATRWQLRRALKEVQRETGVTAIYVTHDQLEALTFAERVSVMADGELLQTGAPQTLVAEPAHTYVAQFVGSPGMNLAPIAVLQDIWRHAPPAGAEQFGFRPEWAEIRPEGPGANVIVDRLKPLTEDAGVTIGMVEASLPVPELPPVSVSVRQPLTGLVPGAAGRLAVDRVCWFARRKLIGSAER